MPCISPTSVIIQNADVLLEFLPGTSSVSGSFIIPIDHLLGLTFISSLPSDEDCDSGGCGFGPLVFLHHLAEGFEPLCSSGSLIGRSLASCAGSLFGLGIEAMLKYRVLGFLMSEIYHAVWVGLIHCLFEDDGDGRRRELFMSIWMVGRNILGGERSIGGR